MIRSADWRKLSAEISPQIIAGFDVDALQNLTRKQRKLLTPPKAFGIHKLYDAVQVCTSATGLAIYGELDRAVAGLLPLQTVPVWEFNIPDYDYILSGVRGTAHLAGFAGRQDLVEQLAPLLDAPPFYYPTYRSMTASALSHFLDLTDEERADMGPVSQSEWISKYVLGIASFGRAYLFGGSDEYPPSRLEHEISRYATAIFTTPGYEPFNPNHYPYQ